MQHYHPFKKTVRGKKGKSKKVFYYWYYDKGVQRQKVIKDKSVKTLYDAALYCSKLPVPEQEDLRIKIIAKDMFLPGSKHIDFLRQSGSTCKESSYRLKRTAVEHVIATYGEYTLEDIKANKVFKYLASQEKSFLWKNRFNAALYAIYEYANMLGYDVKSPQLKQFKGNSVKADALTDKEIALFAKETNFYNTRNYLLFMLLLSTGIRVSEARAIRKKQFLQDKQMLLIDGQLSGSGNEHYAYTKRGNETNPKWRVVIVPATVAKKLTAFISSQPLGDDDYIFTTSSGKPMLISSIRCAFFSALNRAGISIAGRRLTIHSLRHTFVTRMRSYTDADAVRIMAGHSSTSMTDYYTHYRIDDDIKTLQPYIANANRFFTPEKG